jgi:cell division protein FtsI (penicillin-binding protein 3)
MKIKTNILLRIYFVYALILVSAVAVIWKVYYIQNYKDDFWVKKSQEMSTKMFTIPGERGNIYTYDENLLATSIPFFDLFVDFGSDGMTREIFDENVDSLSIYMANNFKKKSAIEYKKILVQAKKAKKRYYLIQRNVDYSTLKEIKQWPLFRKGKYKGGLIVEMKQSRKYPYSLLALRTIGENRENSQSIGLEASYDKYLAGTEGQILKQKISGNLWMPIHNESSIEPKNGDDIVTTIDINLQDATETALKKALDSSKAEFGCAIVMEVETGAIRAIANLGRMENGQLWEIDNYAVSHKSEPGSTFKAASYLMLLDNNYININDTVSNGGGRWNFYGKTMSDEHIHESTLSIRDAFARSSNIAIARLIDKNYKNKKIVFYETMQRYGLTEISGIDLKGETKPNVSTPNSKYWSNLSLPWRATGYEQTFSPIQILTFYNTIANNGYRVQPYLVERVTRNGKTIHQFLPQIGKKPIAKQSAIDDIKELLKGVIENQRGTGRSIQSDYFELAGKSGTAKLLGENKSYSSANQAMFAGFFPVKKPRYSCVVLIYNPKGAHRTGGGISAPVFKEIAEKALSIDLHLSPDYKKTVENKPNILANLKGETHQIKDVISKYGYKMDVKDEIQYIDVEIRKSGIKLQPTASSENIVPNLIGLNFDDALYILENMGLKIRYNGLGKIVQQSIPAGTKISKGSHISITMR